jgi:hypothetical protein
MNVQNLHMNSTQLLTRVQCSGVIPQALLYLCVLLKRSERVAVDVCSNLSHYILEHE